MALSKLDLAVACVAAAGLVCIEHGHRSDIGSLAAAEAAPPAKAVCPATDDAPFSTDCIKFIDAAMAPALPVGIGAAAASSEAERRTPRDAPACPPSNENGPYSARCLRFLSGGFWRP